MAYEKVTETIIGCAYRVDFVEWVSLREIQQGK